MTIATNPFAQYSLFRFSRPNYGHGENTPQIKKRAGGNQLFVALLQFNNINRIGSGVARWNIDYLNTEIFVALIQKV